AALLRGNFISFPVSDRTFSFGARLTPLNQAPLVGKPYYLASLDEMQLIRPTFLETAPLSPFGHFPPLGAALR
ncbi:hypothetical protein, partial [uncultured Dialister sp.]|uniref:hypothetical protein n=1 Tax=uncultured Dialister sp. TaxID=278064 RepID=UPI00265DAC17